MQIRPLVIITILLLLAACGKKGPVRPLQASLPAAVSSVELVQRGGQLQLSWELPARNQDGTPLDSDPVIDIYRMLFDPADYCPECKDRSTLLFSIDPELPNPAQLQGNRYSLTDRQVAPGQGYQYRLVPRTETNQPGQSRRVRITVLPPPAAPEGLQLTAHDRSVTLTWKSLVPAVGQQLLGYRLYRHQVDLDQPPVLLNQGLLAATEYTDINLENGVEYQYRVSAVLKQAEQILESQPTSPISAFPQSGL